MINLEPITTSNLISILQILIVLGGFIFSWLSLEATRKSIDIASRNFQTATDNLQLATANAQAQLYNQMVIQGRDLQFKFMDIYYGSGTDADRRQRQSLYTGTVISYYSACFGLRNVLRLPPPVEKMLDAELKELMRQKPFRDHWDGVSHLHSKEFVAHVASLKGV